MKLSHSDRPTQKCRLKMDAWNSENDVVELGVIHDNYNDRKYVAEETEEGTSKPSKGESRKKNRVRLYKTEM